MLARDAPVSAVSLAEKNADTSSSATTMANEIQSMAAIILMYLPIPELIQTFAASFTARKSRTMAGSTSEETTA